MIRKATASDFSEVFRLFWEGWAENPDMKWPEPVPLRVAQMLEAALRTDEIVILVHPCDDGTVDGILYGYVQRFSWAEELQAVLVLLRVPSKPGSSKISDSLVRAFHEIVDPMRVVEVSFTMSSGIGEDAMVRLMRRHGYERIGVDLRRVVCPLDTMSAD